MKASDRIARIVEEIGELPTMPAVVSAVLSVINSPESGADDAAAIIEKDPALTAKMLRMANSSFYGIPRTISSVSSAVVVLGFNTIASLVLSISVIKMFPVRGGHTLFDHGRFWKHSIVCGLAAKAITRHFFALRLLDPESAFCAGILHDVGKLIFEHILPDDYGEVLQFAAERHISILEAEGLIMGITHADVGRSLSDHWKLPLDLECALVKHHAPEGAGNGPALAATVHCADALAHQKGFALLEGERAPAEAPGARAVLNMGAADYASICAAVDREIEKTGDFFSIVGS
ncbi:MAG: HDOD domain-containing protein [Chitinivibrionales bacterium]|nr:HDOD domain-containing protein [Chitinivibrionales bacterium]